MRVFVRQKIEIEGLFHWIGVRDKLQESLIFYGKKNKKKNLLLFSVDFPLDQSINIWGY